MEAREVQEKNLAKYERLKEYGNLAGDWSYEWPCKHVMAVTCIIRKNMVSRKSRTKACDLTTSIKKWVEWHTSAKSSDKLLRIAREKGFYRCSMIAAFIHVFPPLDLNTFIITNTWPQHVAGCGASYSDRGDAAWLCEFLQLSTSQSPAAALFPRGAERYS